MKVLGWSVVGGVAALALAGVICAAAKLQDSKPVSPALAKFKAAGKGAALTVMPTLLGGQPSAQVGEAVAMLLERGGMTNLETSDVKFTPPEGADLTKAAEALAAFVKANPPATEYALFTDFRITRETGVTEVRGIVVSKQGEIVWQDRQTKGDADFDRVKPREPLQCCLLVAQRLRPVLGLSDPTRGNAPEGKISQRWRQASGLPDKAELEAINRRGQAFKKTARQATLLVYPVHTNNSFSPESARNLATGINEKQLARATAAEQGPDVKIAPTMNQQKVLWGLARACSEYVKKNPPAADYVLCTDYLMGEKAVGGVHLVICNRQGEVVVADLQNSHWPDFKAINPKTRADCNKLVLKRLEGLCK